MPPKREGCAGAALGLAAGAALGVLGLLGVVADLLVVLDLKLLD
jgi:hypothetical protein